MKAILQIVDSASLSVENKQVSQIEKGLLVYLGLHLSDSKEKAEKLAVKVANLRIFKDENGKINLNVKQAGNNALVVSNFTIYGDSSRGTRPNFQYAMQSDQAKEIYEYFVDCLKKEGLNVQIGVFGAHMVINQVTRGPVNIILES